MATADPDDPLALEKDMIDPQEKPVLIVTGGSRGIGAATAKLAAARGWRVMTTYLGRAAAAEVPHPGYRYRRQHRLRHRGRRCRWRSEARHPIDPWH
jgi:NAD(P)-dependent dehydrogenase (short-subunit alcohol dehydrogenase family)